MVFIGQCPFDDCLNYNGDQKVCIASLFIGYIIEILNFLKYHILGYIKKGYLLIIFEQIINVFFGRGITAKT